MAFYWNENTGQVVDTDDPNVAADVVEQPNWHQVDDPDEARKRPTPLGDSVLRRPGMEAATSTNGAVNTALTGNNVEGDPQAGKDLGDGLGEGQRVNEGGPQSGSTNEPTPRPTAPTPGKGRASRG